MKLPINKRMVVLGVVLLATLAAVVWVGREKETPVEVAQVSERAASGPRVPARREAAVNEGLALKPDKMTRVLSESKQNIFATKSWFVPPPPPKPQPPPKPTAPPLPFAYMGKLQEEGSARVVVYLSQGDRAYSVSAGDVIDNTYRVDSIDATQIVMTYLPLTIKQTLPIGSS